MADRKRVTRTSSRRQGPPPDVRPDLSIPAVQQLFLGHQRDRTRMNYHAVAMSHKTSRTGVEGIDFSPLKRKQNNVPQAPSKKLRRSPLKARKNLVFTPRPLGILLPDNKKEPVRVIIETESFICLITSNLHCPKCNTGVHLRLTFGSCGAATIPRLMCIGCSLDEKANIARTNIPRDTAHESVIDYQANFKYVLPFVASGDGPIEADRVLQFLSLPNGGTMRSDTFKIIETASNPALESIARDVLEKNLIKEVELTMAKYNPSFNVAVWSSNYKAGRACTEHAFVNYMMDMGWQKRSSGRRYDSSSGHAFLYGALSRKAIMMCVKSKYCATCSFWQKRERWCRCMSVSSTTSDLPVPWRATLYWKCWRSFGICFTQGPWTS